MPDASLCNSQPIVDTLQFESRSPIRSRCHQIEGFDIRFADISHGPTGLVPLYVKPSTIPTVPIWFDKAYAKLTRYAGLTEGWNGPGTFGPSAAVISESRRFLKLLARKGFCPDGLAPSMVGGMGFGFSGEGEEAFVEFLNSGDVFASVATHDSEPNDFTSFKVELTEAGKEELLSRLDEVINASSS